MIPLWTTSHFQDIGTMMSAHYTYWRRYSQRLLRNRSSSWDNNFQTVIIRYPRAFLAFFRAVKVRSFSTSIGAPPISLVKPSLILCTFEQLLEMGEKSGINSKSQCPIHYLRVLHQLNKNVLGRWEYNYTEREAIICPYPRDTTLIRITTQLRIRIVCELRGIIAKKVWQGCARIIGGKNYTLSLNSAYAFNIYLSVLNSGFLI